MSFWIEIRSLSVAVLVFGVVACSTTPVPQPGTLLQASDQGVREAVHLSARERSEVETASTDTLREWLLPADAPVVSRHRFQSAPPSLTTVVAFDGSGFEIAPGICRYDGWFVSISQGPDPRLLTPFYRQRVPQYVAATGRDCTQPIGGLAASSDAEGVVFVQRWADAQASVRANRGHLRCDEALSDCATAWRQLPAPTSANRCHDERECIAFDFGVLQAKVTGRHRPRVTLYPVDRPVF